MMPTAPLFENKDSHAISQAEELVGEAAPEGGVEGTGERFPFTDQPEVGALKNHRVGIVVNRDNRLGALDTDRMIRHAANANRKIKARLDGLASEADLELMRDPSFVRDAARRA